LEKLRSKLEREICSQKPSLEQVCKKKEELSKNLELSASKEIALSKEFELAMQNLGNDEMKQIVSDAMRMKQLEVQSLNLFQPLFYPNFNSFCLIVLQVALQETKDQNSYLTKALQVQSEESAKSETLLLQLMKTAKSFYLTLRSKNALATYMEEDFNVILLFIRSVHLASVKICPLY
jgi:hypothetical protein